MPFTHTIFWDSPTKTLAFFCLVMSFASLWMRKTAWLWGSFLVVSFVLAYKSGVAGYAALAPILCLLVLHGVRRLGLPTPVRILISAVAFGLSLVLWAHLFPGFHNWELVHQETISPGAHPFTLWLNYDKPFTGIFILALCLPLVASREDFKRMALFAIPFAILTICTLLILALWSGLIRWDPKIPSFFFVWTINNLFLVCMTEEAVLRGFVQEEIFRWLGSKSWSAVIAVLSSSLLFAVLHLQSVRSFPYLSFVFLAALFYGTAYQYTRRIESSILCHFLVNFVHFIGFTYPALQSVS